MLTPKTNAYVQAGITFTRVRRKNGDGPQIFERATATTLAEAKQYLADGWDVEKHRVAFELLAALIEDVKIAVV